MTPLPRLIRWLARLTRLGFPVGDGLRGAVSAEIAERLARGDSLADALPLGKERGMVEAALQSERPVELLERLGETLEATDRLRRQVARALTYPRLLSALVALEFVILLGVLAPLQLAATAHGRADLVQQAQLWQWLCRGGAFLAVGVLCVPLFRPELLWEMARVLRMGPGPVEWLADQALWCRALAQLLDVGRPLPEALTLAARAIHSQPRRAAAERLAEGVARGDNLATLLAPAGFEPLVGWALDGSQIGPALRDAAATLELEVELRIEVQLRLLEPLALVALSGPVLLLLLSFWIPQYGYITPGLADPQG